MNRKPWLLVLALLPACSSATGEDTDTVDTSQLHSPTCSQSSVFQFTPDAGAEAVARAKLDALGIDATITWGHQRGTLATAWELGLELDCKDPTSDASARVLERLAGIPEVFRLVAHEWVGSPVPCSALPNNAILGFTRRSLAGLQSYNDSFSVLLRRNGDALSIHFINAQYLPDVVPGLEEFAKDCPSLSVQDGMAVLHKEELHYDTFAWCAHTGSGTYRAAPPDVLTIQKPSWTWTEHSGGVELQVGARAALTVAPVHHTPSLLSSNANCPWNTVAFSLVFDPVHQTLLSQNPGVDCIVCASGG